MSTNYLYLNISIYIYYNMFVADSSLTNNHFSKTGVL